MCLQAICLFIFLLTSMSKAASPHFSNATCNYCFERMFIGIDNCSATKCCSQCIPKMLRLKASQKQSRARTWLKRPCFLPMLFEAFCSVMVTHCACQVLLHELERASRKDASHLMTGTSYLLGFIKMRTLIISRVFPLARR